MCCERLQHLLSNWWRCFLFAARWALGHTVIIRIVQNSSNNMHIKIQNNNRANQVNHSPVHKHCSPSILWFSLLKSLKRKCWTVRNYRVQPRPLKFTPYFKTKVYWTGKTRTFITDPRPNIQFNTSFSLPTDFLFLMVCMGSVTRVGLLLSSSTACRIIQNISERRTAPLLQYWVCGRVVCGMNVSAAEWNSSAFVINTS